jgi:hypothetical protein
VRNFTNHEDRTRRSAAREQDQVQFVAEVGLDIARGVTASDMTALLSSLPRRSRSSTRSARRLAAMTDPVLLRRVRDGLLALGSEEGPAK